MQIKLPKIDVANDVNFELLTNTLITGFHPLTDNNHYNESTRMTLFFSVPKNKNDLLKNDVNYEQFMNDGSSTPKSNMRLVVLEEKYLPKTITEKMRGNLHETFCNPNFDADTVLGKSELAQNYLKNLDLDALEFNDTENMAQNLAAFNKQFIDNMATNKNYAQLVVSNIEHFNNYIVSSKDLSGFKEGLNSVSAYIKSCYKNYVNAQSCDKIKNYNSEGGRAKV